MLRSSSFLKRTVCTPEMALTTVDFPWATCPMVPVERDPGWVCETCGGCDSGEKGQQDAQFVALDQEQDKPLLQQVVKSYMVGAESERHQ